MIRLLCFLSLCLTSLAAFSQAASSQAAFSQTPVGIPRDLARLRAQQIKDVRYELALSLIHI